MIYLRSEQKKEYLESFDKTSALSFFRYLISDRVGSKSHYQQHYKDNLKLNKKPFWFENLINAETAYNNLVRNSPQSAPALHELARAWFRLVKKVLR